MFYTTDRQLREAEELVRMLPADNILKAPQETPRTTTVQKLWALIVISMVVVMITAMILNIMKLNMR